MNLEGRIESILFVASKPVSLRMLAHAVHEPVSAVVEAVEALKVRHNHEASGIHILTIEDDISMGTNPEHAEAIEGFIKDEIAGELTKAQLETLTVIAYRGPVTRPELEQIRGVNCSLILRNLLMRGLIVQSEEDNILPAYALSFEALRHLGISDVTALPEYEKLHAHAHVEAALEDLESSS